VRRTALVVLTALGLLGLASPARAAAPAAPVTPVRHLVVLTQELPDSPAAPATGAPDPAVRAHGQLSGSALTLDRWPGQAGTPALAQVVGRLDAAGVTWRVYDGRPARPDPVPPLGLTAANGHVFALSRYYADVAAGALPDVALLVAADGEGSATASVLSLAHALTTSSLWDTSALLLQYNGGTPSPAGAVPVAGTVDVLRTRALLLSPWNDAADVDHTGYGDGALAGFVARNWRLTAGPTDRDLGSALTFSRRRAAPVLVVGGGGPGVLQPNSSTLYVGYLLALVVGAAALGWTFWGESRRRLLRSLRVRGRRRARWYVATLVASLRLALVLRRRRPLPAAPAARRGRAGPAAMTLAGLVVWVLVALPVSARADTPGTVVLQTVPPVAGVHLVVGNRSVTTGPGGQATVAVAALDGIAARVRLAVSELSPTTSAALGKVVPGRHVRGESHLSVGLELTSKVQLSLVSGRTGVPVSSVRTVQLHSVTGTVLSVDPRNDPTVSLLSRRAQLVGGQLTSQVVTWSVERVQAAPGVAVTTTGSRFDPLDEATWPLVLQPVHGTVEVSTVPVTPGLTFLLDGASVTTGRDGIARAPVNDLNDVGDRLHLDTADVTDGAVQLLRVGKLKPRRAGERRIVAALAVKRAVTLHFVDSAGDPVDADRVTAVQLDSGSTSVRLTSAQVRTPVMLLAAVGRQVKGVVEPRPVTYAVSAVLIDGGNAVLAGGQRFTPSAEATWEVPLSVFRVTVTAHDALFGSRVSSRLLLTKPDGSQEVLHLRGRRPIAVPPVVRGLYDLAFDAALVGSHSKVLVSRDQEVDVRVVTALDVLVVAVAGVTVTVAAVTCGVVVARRRRRPVS
jgi:hypothetical protein